MASLMLPSPLDHLRASTRSRYLHVRGLCLQALAFIPLLGCVHPSHMKLDATHPGFVDTSTGILDALSYGQTLGNLPFAGHVLPARDLHGLAGLHPGEWITHRQPVVGWASIHAT